MAKGHRSQIKRERNANKDTRPSAKLSYARVSVQKACFVLDAIRGKDVTTALGIVGSLVATYGGQLLGLYPKGASAGFIASVIGAIVVLFIYNMIAKRT